MQQLAGTQKLQRTILPGTKKHKPTSTNFAEILQTVNKPKISKHAEIRMKEREIHFDDNKWNEIASKMKEAKAKGVTDSLVLTDQAALVVSIKNDTVVTVMNRQEADSQVFTNINGTIVMK